MTAISPRNPKTSYGSSGRPVLEVKKSKGSDQGFLVMVIIVALIISSLFIARNALTPICGLQVEYNDLKDIYEIYYLWDKQRNNAPTWVVRKDIDKGTFFILHKGVWMELDRFLLTLDDDLDWDIEERMFNELVAKEQSYIEVERATPIQNYAFEMRKHFRNDPTLQKFVIIPKKQNLYR